jgi:flagellar biosynthesis/type III secretory pathway protein FliH
MSNQQAKSLEILDVSAALRKRKPVSFLPLGSRRKEGDARFKSTGIKGLVKVEAISQKKGTMDSETVLGEMDPALELGTKDPNEVLDMTEKEVIDTNSVLSIDENQSQDTDAKDSNENSDKNVLSETDEVPLEDKASTEIPNEQRETVEEKILEKEAVLDAKINALEVITNECRQSVQGLETSLEEVILDAILQLSKDLVQHEISKNPGILVDKIKKLVKEVIENVESVKIFLSQDDMDLLDGDFKNFSEKIAFDVDVELSSGEVLLRTDNIELSDCFKSRMPKK